MQNVKKIDSAAPKTRDAGQKASRIKLRIAAGVQGLPHTVTATTANVTDRREVMEFFDIRQDPVMQVIVDQLTAWTNADLERMGRGFSIEVAGAEPPLLVLRPRVPAVGGYIERISIRYASDMRSIERVEVLEPGGDSTLIEFSHVRIDAQLPEELF